MSFKTLFTLILIATSAVSVRASECFDDQKLLDLQHGAQPRSTLVYVWSPRMSYSADNVATASRAAASAGLDFVVVHDTRVPSEEISQANAASQKPTSPFGSASSLATPPFVSPLNASKPLCAKQLIQNEALRHFPSAFVVGKQGVHQHPIVGAMPLDAWMSSIQQRLGPR